MPGSDQWFESIAANTALSQSEQNALQEDGFVVIRGPVLATDLTGLSRAYDAAVLQADPADVREGSTTTRVHDFVNRGPEFNGLYLHAPLLEACCKVIKEPFRLSTVVARALNPGKVPKKLHVDFPNDDVGWPMVGFIFMVDAFRPENGATCFLPHSQGMTTAPDSFDGVVPACGPAGSMLIYNGSVWHEHGPNLTDSPRRSIQGALIRRTEKPAIDWQTRMRPETLSTLSPLAMYLLGL
ncbi:MAG: phytanoyl-CoA dioxygenase family protein [Bryobacteraceae bacterium]